MNAITAHNLYFSISILFFILLNFWTIKYFGKCIINYVFDRELEEPEETDFPPIIRENIMFENVDDMFVLFAFSLILVFVWPIFLVLLPYLFLRFIRFLVRLTRGIKKIANVAHKHSNNEIISEKIDNLKF
jgi:hypothetical protein